MAVQAATKHHVGPWPEPRDDDVKRIGRNVGHFAAFEQPDLYVQDVRTFFATER